MPANGEIKQDDDFGGRWREVRPKDFVKQFRIILANERSAKVAKNILLDIAKKNNGKEGMFDMFMQRPNTLARILEKKTIDGNMVNRLKQQITDWIIYEEEKKRKWLASTLLIQTRIRGYLAKVRVKLKREKEAKDKLEFYAATQIQKIIRGILYKRRFIEYMDEAFLRQRRGRTVKFLELALVVKIFQEKGDVKSGIREVMHVIPEWTSKVIPCTVVKTSKVADPKKLKMFIDKEPKVIIQHFGLSADGEGRLDPLVVANYEEGMIVPGPPFWWPLTWNRYLDMAQVGRKPGQQSEEHVTVFEQWEKNKDFIMTKEPRWLGGALMRYLRDRGELPAIDHSKGAAEKKARAKAARAYNREKKRLGRQSYLDLTLQHWEKNDPVLSKHPERTKTFGRPSTLTYHQFKRGTRPLRIVFLEDDGVLCTSKSSPGSLEFEFMERLRNIYYVTGCYFVCVSPRRLSPEMMKHWSDTFGLHGIPASQLLGGTPLLPNNKSGMFRRIDEIKMWLKDQIFIPIQSWIIIDKIDLKAIAPEYAELHKHWVRTHLRKALNEERMNAAINLLLLPIVQRKEKSENKLREDKKQFEENLRKEYERLAKNDPFQLGIKADVTSSRLHDFETSLEDYIVQLEELLKNFEVLKGYLSEDPFLKTRFIVRRSDYPKLFATKQRITREIQKLEGEQIAKQKKREEKRCYEDGGRKCIRDGCIGLCPIQKKGNGKKQNYVACPVKTCGMTFCRICGVDQSQIQIHGLHRHLEVCDWYEEPGPQRDQYSPLYTVEDKEVQKHIAKSGDLKCKVCYLQYEKDLKLHETRKSKKIVQACKTTRRLPKNWFDTKLVPKQVKDIKKRLKNHTANQKFSKKK
jgi:hypothetical protein